MINQHPRALAARLLAIVAAMAIVLAACGDDDATTEDLGALDGSADDSSMDDMGDMGDEHSEFDFGEPAEAADADRTVEVNTLDTFAYDPPSITVSAGETVLFEVTNSGNIPHEFTLGGTALQAEHEDEMAEMDSGMMMGDEPNAIAIAPGETKELAFTFTTAGSIEYACHEPGHYNAGMIGELTVE